MKTKNLLLLLTVGGMMIFASCKKDDSTPTPLTKEEATTSLTTVNGSYTTDMNAFEAAPEVQVADAVDNLDLPFNTSPFKTRNFQKEIQKSYSPSRALKGGDYWEFPWATSVGTWTYTGGYYQLTSPGNPANQVVVIFSYNGGTNNGKLTYYDYATKTASYGGQSATYMSQLKAKVEIDNVVKHTWTYTASISGSLTSMSVNMSMAATYGTTYTHTMSASISATGTQTSAKMTVTMLEELKKNGAILIANSATMVMTEGQTTYSMVVTASFRVKDIIVKFAINVNNTTNFEGDPGLYQKISVWTADGAKVGDVVYVLVGADYVPKFKFTNGDIVALETLITGDLYYDIFDFADGIMDFKK